MTFPVVTVLLAALIWSCLPVSPPPPHLEQPVLKFDGMAPVADPFNGYRESIHLTWSSPTTGSTDIRSFTLFRRIPPDSIFDIFSGSRLIPADTGDFYDNLAGLTFPATGFDTVYYRICAVDSDVRTGDTSETVTVVLAPQANLTRYDTAHGCMEWDSWIRGGVFSWCTVWCDKVPCTFTSSTEQIFPSTDEPARFGSCLPDSLSPRIHGRWYFALYVQANESYSLKVGSLDVP